MSNTFIASGKDDPEIIIKSTVSGLLVKKMGRGDRLILLMGDFVFDVQEAYMIEEMGKLPIRFEVPL